MQTPGGCRKGNLADYHSADLGAVALDALLARSGIDPAAVDDLIFGCVSQAGEQSNHIARSVVLASMLPQSVPAVTIDRQCGSSQQALHLATPAVMTGTQDMVIAGGVEHSTRVAMGSPVRLAADAGVSTGPLSETIRSRYEVAEFSQFTGAQMIADKYDFTHEDMDAFALESHRQSRARNRHRCVHGQDHASGEAPAVGKANVSRVVSDPVRAGLVRRHYAGGVTDHQHRGGRRLAVYAVEPLVLIAIRSRPTVVQGLPHRRG